MNYVQDRKYSWTAILVTILQSGRTRGELLQMTVSLVVQPLWDISACNLLTHDLTIKGQGDCLAVHPEISRLEETRRESLMLASDDCFMELNVSVQFVQPLLDISASNIEPQVSTPKGPRKLQGSSSADFALLNFPSNQSFLILFVP